MLCRTEAICGAFPIHMIKNGKYSNRFFTKSGLIYEETVRADDSSAVNQDNNIGDKDSSDDSSYDDDLEDHVYILQPKITTVPERLGFTSSLRLNDEELMFVDFVRSLLTIDPEKRPTATDALQHPFILQCSSFSDTDIEYP